MEILHVITSMTTGGAENLVSELVPMMIDCNHHVNVLLFNGKDTPFKKKLEKNSVRIISFGENPNVYSIKNLFKLIPILGKYDIVHTHNTACQFFVAMAKTLSHAKCKLVTTEHSTENRRRYIWWCKPIDKWMYKQYDCIISISDIATKALKEYLGAKYSIMTIANGVDVSKFRNAVPIDNIRQDDEVIITMVAGFRVGKDQDTLIKSLTELPDNYKVWLIGDGVRRKEIEALINELKLNSRVKLWGIRTDVPQLLKSSDIIVMSSRYEGLSLSSIEGMTVGKPFIASDVKGLHETTIEAGLLFPYQDYSALAKDIKKLHEDKDYCKNVADKCFERAKMFDISKTIDGYLRVYDELESKL
jgi:glycosyltransferase involved in cell wall biosynthesis